MYDFQIYILERIVSSNTSPSMLLVIPVELNVENCFAACVADVQHLH